MKIILHLMLVYVRLILRLPISLVFNVIFPLAFFFFYVGIVARGGASMSGLIVRLITLGALSNGLFGLSIALVIMRERDILRRYHLTPISAFHIVVSRLLANYLFFSVVLILQLTVARALFKLDIWPVLPQILLVFTLGYLAVAGIGFIIAAIVNTVNDAQVYNQLTFFGLLFLSGIAIPLSSMPHVMQGLSAFLPPALTVVAGNEVFASGVTPWAELLCLLVISLVTLGVSTVMFRWEKEAKVSGRDRLKAAVILAPVLLAGIWLNFFQGFTERINRVPAQQSTASQEESASAGLRQ